MSDGLPQLVQDYFAALNAIDRDAYVACFNRDAVVEDPYGGPTYEGVDGLNQFFDGMERTWQLFKMEPGQAYPAGDRVAVTWQAEATAKNGKTAQFAGVNVFELGDDGAIIGLEGYWDFKAMLAQIR